MGKFDHPLKDFFRSVGYHQTKLARDVGVSKSHLCRILQNQKEPSGEVRLRMYKKARDLGYDGPLPEGLKECELCREIVENDGNGKLCNKCKGLTQKYDGGPRMSAAEQRSCRECGEPVEPYKLGAVLVRNFCRKCLRRRAAARRRNMIVIDLESAGRAHMAEEIREWLEREADENLRSVNAQALYCIIKVMREAR